MGRIVAAALVLTALNACKPLVVDDAAYVLYARQILEQPGDPYGFEVLWYDRPEPALHVTVPPVLPYWLATGMALFGQHPVAWKLWLFPFALLLAGALHALLRRLAPGLEAPVLFALVLSPAVLTSFNLMLDIPVLALGVGCVATTVRALEQRSLSSAGLAGLLGGLAMQTKYPGVVLLAVAVAFALRAGERRIALGVGSVAVAIFVGWEALALLHYGESAFLYGLFEADVTRDASKPLLEWTVALLALLGATASAAGLLGLVALGARTAILLVAALFASGVYLAIPFLPAASLAFAGKTEPDFAAPRPELWPFTLLGLALVGISTTLAWAGRGTPRGPLKPLMPIWISFEVAGYFLFSPFPAVRRVIGLGVALTLWAASAAAAGGVSPRPVRGVAIWGVMLGLLFFSSDLSDAHTRRNAVMAAIDQIRAIDPGGDAGRWFTGHWGFRYYAEAAGLRPVAPGTSALSQGDFLLVPSGVQRQALTIDSELLEAVARIVATSPSPWTSIPSFYTGPVALRSQPEIHVAVTIYRVRHDFVTAPARRRPVRRVR